MPSMGQHPHGYRSPFEWRFYEDWALVKLKSPPAERVVFDWSPDRRFRHPGVSPTIAKAKMPGIARFAVGERIVDKEPEKDTPVVAMFIRSSGFQYG